MKAVKYCALIVTHNSATRIECLLKRVLAQTLEPATIILVDNASTDGTVEIAERIVGRQLVLVRNKENLGGAGGFEKGFRTFLELADTDFLWTFDDDAVPTSDDCAAILIDAMHNRALDISGPLVIATGNPDRLSFAYSTCHGKTYDVNTAILAADSKPIDDVKFFNGAMFSRRSIEACGVPVGAMFIRGDEAEYSSRMRRKGMTMVSLTNARVTHPSSEAEYTSFLKRRIWTTRQQGKFYFRHRNRAYTLLHNGRPGKLLSEALLYSAFMLIREKSITMLSDYLWAILDGMTGLRNNTRARRFASLCSNGSTYR